MPDKTLEELSAEYRQAEQQIRERIRELRAALPVSSEADRKRLEPRVRGLYEMAANANKIAQYLAEYYTAGVPARKEVC